MAAGAHTPPREVTLSLPKVLLAASEGTVSGDTGMIYLPLPPELFPAGYPKVRPPHVTVVYLGKITPKRFDSISERVHATARAMPPLHGMLGGLGVFPPSLSSGGKRVAYVPVQADGLYQLNHALRDLASPEAHPFRPHATLAYIGPDDPLPPPVTSATLCFSRLFVRRGTETRSFAFQGHHLPRPFGGRHQPPVSTDITLLSYPSALQRVLAAADSCCGVGLALEAPRSASGI